MGTLIDGSKISENPEIVKGIITLTISFDKSRRKRNDRRLLVSLNVCLKRYLMSTLM